MCQRSLEQKSRSTSGRSTKLSMRQLTVTEVKGHGRHEGHTEAYRGVGANAASLGSLTHSAAALPFHLELRPARLNARRT